MANLELKNIGHNYHKKVSDDNFAIRHLSMVFESGFTYALLGPSGCGKTTLLNIISGLITPTEGQLFIDGEPMVDVPTNRRHIAQVFQFPVVYDTMTVYENLAFPLKNHNYPKEKIPERVKAVAEMVELTDRLHQKASGLSADGKQKISLGRGLVREDIKAILFDEPLTVIDPHLKWKIRTRLKKIHRQINTTMIYVTHDQTEALSFADRVIVMHEGKVVQIGSPVDLFEKCNHTFVGHFIGSPGINLLEVEKKGNDLTLWGLPLDVGGHVIEKHKHYQIGIRPEKIVFTSAGNPGIPVEVTRVQLLGHYKILEINCHSCLLKMVIPGEMEIPDSPNICFPSDNMTLFGDSWAVNSPVALNIG